jgi:hypothetical protein
LSTINANAFIKDGFLKEVTWDSENDKLTFTWNTDAGVTKTDILLDEL